MNNLFRSGVTLFAKHQWVTRETSPTNVILASLRNHGPQTADQLWNNVKDRVQSKTHMKKCLSFLREHHRLKPMKDASGDAKKSFVFTAIEKRVRTFKPVKVSGEQ